MDIYEVFKSVIVPFIAVCVVPVIGWFGHQIIRLMKKYERIESDFHHLKGNYAQAFQDINAELNEMNGDLKELLRIIHRYEGPK